MKKYFSTSHSPHSSLAMKSCRSELLDNLNQQKGQSSKNVVQICNTLYLDGFLFDDTKNTLFVLTKTSTLSCQPPGTFSKSFILDYLNK